MGGRRGRRVIPLSDNATPLSADEDEEWDEDDFEDEDWGEEEEEE